MPSLWDKIRSSRKRSKEKRPSDASDDDYISGIRKRESYIETTKNEDWMEVDHPKSLSLGRGLRLESSREKSSKKSRTLDGNITGFGALRGKNEWKPKVKDIEEIKVRETKDKSKLPKKEKDKKKDKRKSKIFDHEDAQIERGESALIGRKMVLWNGGRKRSESARLYKEGINMDPVSTVDEWAASMGALTSATEEIETSNRNNNRPRSASASDVDKTTTPEFLKFNRLPQDDNSGMNEHNDTASSMTFTDTNNRSQVAIVASQYCSPGPILAPPSSLRTIEIGPESKSPQAQLATSSGLKTNEATDLNSVLHSPIEESDSKIPAKFSLDHSRSPSTEFGPLLRSPKDLGPIMEEEDAPTSPKAITGPVLMPPFGGAKKLMELWPVLHSPTSPVGGESHIPILKVRSKKKHRPKSSHYPSATSPSATSPTASGAILRAPSAEFRDILRPPSWDFGDLSPSSPVSPVLDMGPIMQPPLAHPSIAIPPPPSSSPPPLSSSPPPLSETNTDPDLHHQHLSLKPELNGQNSLNHDHHNGHPSPISMSSPDDDFNRSPLIGVKLQKAAKSAIDILDDAIASFELISSPDDQSIETDCSQDAVLVIDSVTGPTLETTNSPVRDNTPDRISLTTLQEPPSKLIRNSRQNSAESGYQENESRDPSQNNILLLNEHTSEPVEICQATSSKTDVQEFFISSTKYYENEELPENGVFVMEMQDSMSSAQGPSKLGALHIDLTDDDLVTSRDLSKSHDEEELLCDLSGPPSDLCSGPSSSNKSFDQYGPQPGKSPVDYDLDTRPQKPICLVAYPRRLMLSPCDRCARSIDLMLQSTDSLGHEIIDLDSPMEQDVHDWVLVEKDFESPKFRKRRTTCNKQTQTEVTGSIPIDCHKKSGMVLVCSSGSSITDHMRHHIHDRDPSAERTPSYVGTEDGCDSMSYDDYVIPSVLLRANDVNHYRISGQCSDEFELFGQSPSLVEEDQSNKAVTKASTSKPAVSQIKGAHQPDLVSNSIGSRAHAAQEISRLEALCENRTKELTFAKMQIRSASQGFDAMSVIVQYLTEELNAFSAPELHKRLHCTEKKINGLLENLAELRSEKSRIESTMHDLIQSHKEATEAMKADHRAQITGVEERINKKQNDDVQKVIDQHSEEVKTLKVYQDKKFAEQKNGHVSLLDTLEERHSENIAQVGEKHELHLEELQKQHEIRLEEITKRFEEIKFTLHDKVYTLKAECDELRSRSLMYEEALQRDTNFQVQKPPLRKTESKTENESESVEQIPETTRQVQLALAPYRDLPQEIDSLRAVLEMRNKEIHELRTVKIELESQLHELPFSREKIISLEQKIENLEAIVAMKADYERQLVEKHQLLLRRYDKESKQNKRLSMDNEELMYRLDETENMLLSPSPDGRTGRSPDGQSPDILAARRGFCRSPHESGIPSPHSVVTRRQRTSSTSSSNEDKRSSTISMRSEEEKGT